MTLEELFTLTPAGAGKWIAPGAPPTGERCVYGGLVVAQAILAASADNRRCHALHCLFIGMGAKQTPFEIDVERTRDGGSFSTRRIEVHQGDRLLLAGYSSHHDGDHGPEHQISMPDAPPPEGLEDRYTVRKRRAEQSGTPLRSYLAEQLLDARPVSFSPAQAGATGATQGLWFRSREKLRADRTVHQAAIGFASDIGLVRVGLQAHPPIESGSFQTASLDHSIWFHRDADTDDWLLQVLRSPVAREGRGLSFAEIFTRDGLLVASVAQEFLARHKRG